MKVEGLDPLVLGRIQARGMEAPVQEIEEMEAETPAEPWDGPELGMGEAPLGEDAQPEDMEEALERLNSTVEAFDKDLRFRLHEESERWMVEVWDMEQDEVIKRLPPERVLNVVAQIQEVLGIMIDEKR